jgi:hypothetical protein
MLVFNANINFRVIKIICGNFMYNDKMTKLYYVESENIKY